MYEGDTPNAERRAAALSPGPRPAARAAGPGGAARPDRPGRAGRGRGRPAAAQRAHPRGQRRLAARRAALGRRPDARRRWASGCCPASRSTRCSRCCRATGARSRCGWAAQQRWIASEDAGLYRDAFGAVPPGGLPAAFLDETPDPFQRLVRRFARTHGPFTTRELHDRFAVDPTPVLQALESRRRAGARRAAPRRKRARVVRHRRAAPAAARLAGRAAQGGRAGRAAGAGALPALVAGRGHLAPRRRGRGPAARAAGAAAGRGAGALGVGGGRAAPPRGRLLGRHGWTSCARRASSCGSAPGPWAAAPAR